MKQIRPWQDAICLLAGAGVPRSARPGERIDSSRKHSNVKRVSKQIRTAAALYQAYPTQRMP